MARRVFFSFHYDRDIWHANVVRNSWVTQERESAGFWDASLWEKTKKRGDEAIRRLIDEGLKGSSVTAVLIGADTSGRKWVEYEIKESHNNGKGLLGVYIHKIEDVFGNPDSKGRNPFDDFHITENGKKVLLSQIYPTYDWVNNDGYKNFGGWIEEAARKAGR